MRTVWRSGRSPEEWARATAGKSEDGLKQKPDQGQEGVRTAYL